MPTKVLINLLANGIELKSIVKHKSIKDFDIVARFRTERVIHN